MTNYVKFLKNKRGVENEVLFIIIESVLIIVIFIALFQWVNSIAKDESFEKMALSRDIALMVNTVQYLPGDLEYTYLIKNIDMSKFNYIFEDNSIQIKDPKKPLIVSYPFSENNLLSNNFPHNIENPKSIEFENKNDIFKIIK